MSRVVLDSSAVLAVVYEERGAAKVVEILEAGETESLVSAVNLCEIQTRLLRDGLSIGQVSQVLSEFDLTVIAFGESEALEASALSPATKALGLSLGDRACLALALALAVRERVTVWTADSVWKKLRLGVEIELIRL